MAELPQRNLELRVSRWAIDAIEVVDFKPRQVAKLVSTPIREARSAASAGRRMPATSSVLSLVVIVSGGLWFVSVATNMTDSEMSWETARFVLTETTFGALCLARLGTIAVLVSVLALLTVRPGHRLDLCSPA